MQIEELYKIYRVSTGVSTDTRSIEKGNLFFALRGANFDANALAGQAIERGAAYAVIDNPEYSSDRTILLSDALVALQELARYHRSQRSGPVLGITGSNGKTTTKELIAAAMSATKTLSVTAGNYNNHIGVPLTILAADVDDDLWIIEMGTNQPGDIELLCSIASPTHGLITNIGLAHLERLGSQQGIYEEKTKLYDSVVARGGTLFVNADDIMLSGYEESYKRISYYDAGQSPWGKISIADDEGMYMGLSVQNGDDNVDVPTYLVGDYNVINVSAALTVAHHYGVELADAVLGIKAYEPSNMRSQHISTDHNEVILDGYNANPSSMRLSVETFVKQGHRNSVLILGDMLELGEHAERLHDDILSLVKDSEVSYYLVGEHFAHADDTGRAYASVEDLISYLASDPIKGCHILLKGSRGIKLERLLPCL